MTAKSLSRPIMRIVATSEQDVRGGASDVAAARRGQQAAMRAVYDAHFDYILCMCVRLMRDAERGMDAAQEAFAVAFEKLSQLRDDGAFRPWVAQSAVRICRTQLRRDRMFRAVGLGPHESDDDPVVNLIDHSVSDDIRLDLRAAALVLASLPVSSRIAWTLKHLQDESLVKIAELTGRSLASVKRDIDLAEHELRRRLGGAS